MKVYRNIKQAITLQNALKKDGRNLKPDDLSIIENAALVFDDNKIIWVGKDNELPREFQNLPSENLSNYILTPELVDSHTHLVFGGNRAEEYVQRLNGKTYEEIAKSGGGILFTSEQTKSTSKENLKADAINKIERIYSYGIGTIEIKTGYGLDTDTEYKCAKIINELKEHFKNKVQIFCTYLGAHAVPKGQTSSSYLDSVVIPLLKKLNEENLIDFIDIFHEQNYFSNEDVIKLFQMADSLNIKKRIHVDELNDNHGAALAVNTNCLSADHLLKVNHNGIQALAKSKTIATLLPGTALFLGKPLAPAREILDSGVKVSLASDFNPGSCHIDNLLLIALISAANLKMNIAELWCSITLNPAHSLGLYNQGSLTKDLSPRFTKFKASSLNEIIYNLNSNFCTRN
jgi:imidazolonepropionase